MALAAATSACGGTASSPSNTPPDVATITIQAVPPVAPPLLFQDGDGPWVRLQGTNGTYSTPVTGQRYAVAMICRHLFDDSSRAQVELHYLSVSDTTDILVSGCVETRPTVRVSAQLQGVPSDQQGEVFFGDVAARQRTTGGPFEATLIRGEPVDVLISTLDAANVPRKVYRGPALDALADKELQFDLNALGAPPDSLPLTLTGLAPTERVDVRSLLSTRPSQGAWFVDYRPFSTTPPDRYSSVPVAAGRQPGDITVVSMTVALTDPSEDGRSYERGVAVAMTTPAPSTVALPAPWSFEGPTLDNTAQRRATLTLPAAITDQDAVDYRVHFFVLGGNASRFWVVTIGAGWLEGRGAVTLTTPDLSEFVEGAPDIALPLDRDVSWVVTRTQRNIDYDVVAADGMRVLSNRVFGTISPPKSP